MSGDVKLSIRTPLPMDIVQSLLHACALYWPDGGIDPNGEPGHLNLVIPADSRKPKRVSKAALLAGRQQAEEGDTDVLGFERDADGVSLKLETPEELSIELARLGAGLLGIEGAENYVEFTCTDRTRPDGERMVVTVQRMYGKTPHEKRQEVERELEALRAKVGEA
ncbi:hypothetical protein [Kineosporia babensis]|uniref:Uncharacterized protein n=1 Tax=Kineosporia babensis TaxID=499548 RepID=A0A9X1ST40_9ACTN|nr:hypothetical protein [Kineosporia babensis]MCD5310916.1 hypothetical protein [Kineosporia babensis]